jgi:hypothetical protein
LRAIGPHDAEPIVVGGDMKLIAQGNDMRIDLDHQDAGLRQVAIAEFGQRSLAQANHGDVLRFCHEQQKSHHHARVLQVQRIGVSKSHAALHFANGEVQSLGMQGVVDKGPDVVC